MEFDAIVIGGGAAGLFCALEAGKRKRRVLVIEHNAQPGRKILISGGGRCNFTNTGTAPENFVSQNPHFCKSALSRYTPADFVSLVRKHRIPYYEKKLGQLFCRDSARSIVDMLLSECSAAGVTLRTGCSVSSVNLSDDGFVVSASQGEFRAAKLVVACGGLSFPKVGATDLGYRIASQFGLKIVQTRPSLVAMVMAETASSALAGVSAPAEVRAGRQSFRENILFTHRGLSGPAILQVSNYWRRDQAVEIDLAPDVNVRELITGYRDKRQSAASLLRTLLPARLAADVAERAGVADRNIADLSTRDIGLLADLLNDWKVIFSATEGWDRAEVTLGGVSTDELSSRTMESKRVRGCYFIGEVVDVTGWLGGYNFQWAWSSGHAAGTAI